MHKTLAKVNECLLETGHKALKEATLWLLPDDIVVVLSIRTGKPIYAMRLTSDGFFSIPHLIHAVSL